VKVPFLTFRVITCVYFTFISGYRGGGGGGGGGGYGGGGGEIAEAVFSNVVFVDYVGSARRYRSALEEAFLSDPS
jgi:hypothetical protein